MQRDWYDTDTFESRILARGHLNKRFVTSLKQLEIIAKTLQSACDSLTITLHVLCRATHPASGGTNSSNASSFKNTDIHLSLGTSENISRAGVVLGRLFRTVRNNVLVTALSPSQPKYPTAEILLKEGEEIQAAAWSQLKEQHKARASQWSRNLWKEMGRRKLKPALPPKIVPRLGPLELLLSKVQSEQKEQIEACLWKLACFSYNISCLKKIPTKKKLLPPPEALSNK